MSASPSTVAHALQLARPGSRYTEAWFATQREAEDFETELLEAYPPEGYGTWITVTPSGTLWRVEWRIYSCD
jgi:hypothetical protein